MEDTLDRRRRQGYRRKLSNSLDSHLDIDISSPKPLLNLFISGSLLPSFYANHNQFTKYQIEEGNDHGDQHDLDIIDPVKYNGGADTQIVPRVGIDDTLGNILQVSTQLVGHPMPLPELGSPISNGLLETQIVYHGIDTEDAVDDSNLKVDYEQTKLGNNLKINLSDGSSNGDRISGVADTQIVNRDPINNMETQVIEPIPEHGSILQDIPSNDIVNIGIEDEIGKEPVSPLESRNTDSNHNRISDAQIEVYKDHYDTTDLAEDSPVKTSNGNGMKSIPNLAFNMPPLSQSSPVRAVATCSVVQIPNTVEKNKKSQLLAQVQNTQEDTIDVTFQANDRGDRPVYLSSQKQEINTDESDNDENKEMAACDETEETIYKSENEIIVSKEESKPENILEQTNKEAIALQLQRAGDDGIENSSHIEGDIANESNISLSTRRTRRLNRKRRLSDSELSFPTKEPVNILDSDNSQSRILREELLDRLFLDDIKYIRSVWAEYKFKMYPGTLIESNRDNLTVQFDDLVSEIKNSDLHQLDIRVGDRIRHEGIAYEVTGLVDKLQKNISKDIEGSNCRIQCIRGYNYVYLSKLGKKRVRELLVPLARCFMEIEDWMEHQQKFLVAGGNTKLLLLPPTRSRQSDIIPEVILKTEKKSGTIINNTEVSFRKQPNVGVFTGCLFLLTNNEDIRRNIQKLIKDNGGVLLELLEEVTLYKETNEGLRIELEYLSNFRFAAVISNGFCRSAKYLQILSVGWPVLANGFIYDAVKNNEAFDLWPSYLLPSGQLQILQTITSCDIYQFRRQYEDLETTLDMQLQNNSHILADVKLVVVKGKLGQAKGNMSTCEFIFHALGALCLEYATNLNQAIQRCCEKINSGGKCLVYIHSCNADTLLSYNTLNVEQTGASNGNGTKRKRRKGGSKATSNSRSNNKSTKGNTQINVIDWEWVVQCVISSHAWESKFVLEV